MDTVPLVFTTKGNLPIRDLEHFTDWRVSPEQIIFTEGYRLNGEVVKQSTHVYLPSGAGALAAAGAI